MEAELRKILGLNETYSEQEQIEIPERTKNFVKQLVNRERTRQRRDTSDNRQRYPVLDPAAIYALGRNYSTTIVEVCNGFLMQRRTAYNKASSNHTHRNLKQ